MSFTQTLSLLSLVVAATAAPFSSASPIHSRSAISWSACNATELTSTLPMDCGTLLVPLDYTNTSSNATLELQLARIPALSRPSRGSIQFNFGGPGEPGRPLLAQFAPVLRNLTAGEYDLIAFDPRGTGSTLPFRCAETDLEAQYLLLGLGQTANSSDTALGKVWAQAAVVSETCAESQNETGALIGTAFGARDLMQVVDALGEDGMLRYWGLSYGTTLGATVAAMFPDRIDKVILDGVQNPHEYYHAPASFDMTEQADGVFSAVFSTCVEAGPEKCPLAAKNMTAPQLESAVWDLLENQLKPRPLVLGTTMLDYSTAKGLIVKILYDNSGWPTLATIMGLLLADEINEVLLTQFFDALDQSNQTVLQQWQINTGLYGIHCGDRTSRTDDLNEWLETYEILTDGSRILGDYIAAQEMICAQWKIDAKEKYEGNFTATTENPMLIITNSGDPVTPMTSAHNVSSGFEGSVVLEVDGYGHASISIPSSCTLQHVSRYWADGTLPRAGTRCQNVEGTPYAGVTWNDVFQQTCGDSGSQEACNAGLASRKGETISRLVGILQDAADATAR